MSSRALFTRRSEQLAPNFNKCCHGLGVVWLFLGIFGGTGSFAPLNVPMKCAKFEDIILFYALRGINKIKY